MKRKHDFRPRDPEGNPLPTRQQDQLGAEHAQELANQGQDARELPRIRIVRLDHVQQAESDWREGVALAQQLHHDLGQALEALDQVAYPVTQGHDPAQAVLDVHHGLLEVVALFAEALARYNAAHVDAAAIAQEG